MANQKKTRRGRPRRVNGAQWFIEESDQLLNNIKKQHVHSSVKINGRTESECEARTKKLMSVFHNVLNVMGGTMSDTKYIENVPSKQVHKRQSKYQNRDRQKTSKADTPRQLFIEHKKEIGETNFQHRLSRQYKALDETEKLKSIQMAKNKNKEAINILPNDDGSEQPNAKRRRLELSSKLQTSTMKPTENARQVDSELEIITSTLRRMESSITQLQTDVKSVLSLSANAEKELKARIHQCEVHQAKLEKKKPDEEHMDEVEDVGKASDVGEHSTTTMKGKQQEVSSKLQTSTEVGEPKRIPLNAYNYYKLFEYRECKDSGAKITYLRLSREVRKKIFRKHKRERERYESEFERYIEPLSAPEKEKLEAKIRAEEANDSSNPDDD